MTKELKQEYTLRVSQANKSQMIVILYDLIIEYTKEAEEAGDDRKLFGEAIRKIRGCLNELMLSLNFQYELAQPLFQLYLYVNRESARAERKNSIECLEHIRMVISGLREAYEEVSRQDTSGPVMENTQSVYAGLTYGKNTLNENLSNQGVDRGFLV